MTYYALYDKQTKRVMATGINSRNLCELGGAYLQYISNDLDEEDKPIIAILNSSDESSIRSIIESNEFYIDESQTPFCDECNSTNTEPFHDDESSGNFMGRCCDCAEIFTL